MRTQLPAPPAGNGEEHSTPLPAHAPGTGDATASERAVAAYLVAGLPSSDEGPSPAHFIPLVEFLSRG